MMLAFDGASDLDRLVSSTSHMMLSASVHASAKLLAGGKKSRILGMQDGMKLLEAVM